MHGSPFRAKIAQIRLLTREVREITFDLLAPACLTVDAGQVMAIRIPATNSSGALTRYYSLASPPGEVRSFSLLIRTQVHGSSAASIARWKEGDEVMGQGPLGTFRIPSAHRTPILFVATGTGIAPFKSWLFSRHQDSFPDPVTLLWGLRSETDLYYHDEFQRLSKVRPNFRYHLALSNPGPGWSGLRGRVTAHVEALAQDRDVAVYLCGHSHMIAEVRRLLRARGHRHLYAGDHWPGTVVPESRNCSV
ncbi:MAG: hypothetical protein D6690_01490 [Nitrospirae bacterium]|nr:MAG: hypothetical protein D6690_01490 [Nitrospirota bacterium]